MVDIKKLLNTVVKNLPEVTIFILGAATMISCAVNVTQAEIAADPFGYTTVILLGAFMTIYGLGYYQTDDEL